MAVSGRHIFRQGSTIAALGSTSVAAMMQKFRGVSSSPEDLPGSAIKATYAARSPELVRDYIRHVGGSPSSYKGVLPAHFFPQWAFGLAGKTLFNIPYPLLSVMNGGCRLEINHPLPSDEPLEVSARLESIDDNGRRAVLHQRIVTGTASVPEALVAHMYPIIPFRKKKKDPNAPKKEPARVPEDARELAFWKLSKDAGLDFAKLTGDFNPIHWVPFYAKMFGFRSTILHGFSTMARAMESIHQNLYAGTAAIREWDVRFTKPLVLPGRVGLYLANENEIYVGDAPGGPAYLTGTFST